MNTNLENPGDKEEKTSGLQHVLDVIKKNGLPSKEEMQVIIENVENQKVRDDIAIKLAEYKPLFDKFKDGSASDGELSRMATLATELENIRNKLGLDN